MHNVALDNMQVYSCCGHRFKVNPRMLHFHAACDTLTNAWDNQAFLVKSSTPPSMPNLSGAHVAGSMRRKDPRIRQRSGMGPVAWQEGRSRIKRSSSTPANCGVVQTEEDAGSAGSTGATVQSRDWFFVLWSPQTGKIETEAYSNSNPARSGRERRGLHRHRDTCKSSAQKG